MSSRIAGTLLVVVALSVGAYWYSVRNALPSCGSPAAVGLVTKLLSDEVMKNLSSEQGSTLAASMKLSLELVEKGEISSGGNVRKCSAQLVATFSPELSKPASTYAIQAAALQRAWDNSARSLRVPLDYELKKLDNSSSEFLGSIPQSPQVEALAGMLTLLGGTYVPPTASSSRSDSSQPPAPLTMPPGPNESLAQFIGDWTGKSYASNAIVGGMNVFLDEHPRITFENGGTLEVAIADAAGHVFVT